MKHFGHATVMWLGILSSSVVAAQSMVGEPEFIRVQRQAIAQERQRILGQYEQSAKLCWQRFAVNTCLADARQVRRSALEPLRQQDLVLNTQERLWRTEQRDLRLQGKPTENSVPP